MWIDTKGRADDESTAAPQPQPAASRAAAEKRAPRVQWVAQQAAETVGRAPAGGHSAIPHTAPHIAHAHSGDATNSETKKWRNKKKKGREHAKIWHERCINECAVNEFPNILMCLPSRFLDPCFAAVSLSELAKQNNLFVFCSVRFV